MFPWGLGILQEYELIYVSEKLTHRNAYYYIDPFNPRLGLS